jgi:hypothetical protein
MSASIYDRPPLPLWMRGRLPLSQADPRWLRFWSPGPDTIDLRAIERDLAWTGRLPSDPPLPSPARLTLEQHRSGGRARMATLSPNERRAIAAAGGRVCWRGKSAAERKAIGARLAEPRRRRVRLLPASLVDGLVVDTTRHPCDRCGRMARPYVRRLDAGPRTPVWWRCARHAYAQYGGDQ